MKLVKLRKAARFVMIRKVTHAGMLITTLRVNGISRYAVENLIPNAKRCTIVVLRFRPINI